MKNRSAPSGTVVPVLIYRDVAAAIEYVHVRVEDVDSHHERARGSGARILEPPSDTPFGERQYSAEDLDGHRWTFSQSVADVEPATWGAVLAAPHERGGAAGPGIDRMGSERRADEGGSA